MLAFFDSGCVQVTIPAWDCLPYDRVSPRADIASRRLSGLVRLLGDGAARPRVVLTTVNAAVQRVPPRAMLADATLPLEAGATLEVETLLGYLERNGFVRAGTVMEAGDYAVRGGIVDIFPPNAERPVRLDYFGDTVETVHWFDPLSQRRGEPAGALHLAPVSEVLLTPQSIARFRGAYRRAFGAMTGDDPLYEAVTAARRYPGIEHWLPLFHDGLETLFDYVPAGPVVLDHRAMAARDDRFETIADFFDARANPPATTVVEVPYHAVAPETLFLDADEWGRLLDGRPVVECSPFVETADGADAGAREGRDFVAERAQQGGALFERVGEHIERLQENGLRVLIASGGAGSRDRMVRLLREHGQHAIEPVADWRAASALPPAIAAAAVLPLERGFVSSGLAVIAEQDVLGARGEPAGAPPAEACRGVPRRCRGARGRRSGGARGPRYRPLRRPGHARGRSRAPRLPAHPLRRRRPAVPAGREHRAAVPLRLGRSAGRAGPARRCRLAGAQGEAQATHPRHGEPAHRARGGACDPARAAACRARRPLRRLLRGLPLRRDRRSGPRHRRGDRRPRRRAGDGPAGLRRRRLRQDGSGAARGLPHGACRQAGRGADANHPAEPAAFADLQRTLRPAAGGDRPALAPGASQGAGGDQARHRRRHDRHRHRHPCAARQADRLQRPRPRRRGRGAAFWRRSQGAPEAAQGGGACADAHRNADPAHPADGAERPCAT